MNDNSQGIFSHFMPACDVNDWAHFHAMFDYILVALHVPSNKKTSQHFFQYNITFFLNVDKQK